MAMTDDQLERIVGELQRDRARAGPCPGEAWNFERAANYTAPSADGYSRGHQRNARSGAAQDRGETAAASLGDTRKAPAFLHRDLGHHPKDRPMSATRLPGSASVDRQDHAHRGGQSLEASIWSGGLIGYVWHEFQSLQLHWKLWIVAAGIIAAHTVLTLPR